MLLAYIDEIGQPGAYISPDHKKYSQSPAFGYAGFVIPAESAREFGSRFTQEKRTLYASEFERAGRPGGWEVKGANLLYAKVAEERPQNLRVLGSLIRQLRNFGGELFYYADEKPIGSPKETNLGAEEIIEREASAMRKTLNRLARYAHSNQQQILVMADQINEKSRQQRLPVMYQHILGRAAAHEDMRKIVEPPMHIDSELSSNIQFADWVASLVGRAIDYQLVQSSRYQWVTENSSLGSTFGAFTYESKLRFCNRQLPDLNHSAILKRDRVLYPQPVGHLIGESQKAKLERVRRATFGN